MRTAVVKSVFFVFLLILIPNLILRCGQRKLNLSKQVQNLNLDSTDVGTLLYYSKGYLTRGVQISKQIENARLFYLDSLGIDVQIKIALLDALDYSKVSFGIPYGLPFIRNGLVMLPADTSVGAVKDMYASFAQTASEDIISNLENVGFGYKEGLSRMVDLIGLHEIGHAQINVYRLDTRQKWFNEFMASYFAYVYMQIKEPKMAVIWDNITHAGFQGYTPKHNTLDIFNKLYLGVGFDDYVWFQNAFQERIREIYPKKGLDFIRLVQDRLSDFSFQPKTADELLKVLEEIEPGFIKWAGLIEK